MGKFLRLESGGDGRVDVLRNSARGREMRDWLRVFDGRFEVIVGRFTNKLTHITSSDSHAGPGFAAQSTRWSEVRSSSTREGTGML